MTIFRHLIPALIFTLLPLWIFSQNDENNVLFSRDGYRFPYTLTQPDREWKLPKKLVEISGLSYAGKHRLACVQDEKGSIFIFNTKNGEVTRKIDFAGDGDYEGIEIVGNDAWVLKSNGNLYKVKNYLDANDPKVKKYDTPLSGIHNAEGLALDATGNSLLIALKGYPFFAEKDEAASHKAIYRFDLTRKMMDTAKPFLLISLDSIKVFKHYNTLTRLGIALMAFFDSAEGDVSFQPSGIAVHPVNGNIYVLASVGKLLAVFSPEGKMQALIRLLPEIHRQPEGICFTPEGTLYISNEGQDGRGKVLKFEQIEKP